MIATNKQNKEIPHPMYVTIDKAVLSTPFWIEFTQWLLNILYNIFHYYLCSRNIHQYSKACQMSGIAVDKSIINNCCSNTWFAPATITTVNDNHKLTTTFSSTLNAYLFKAKSQKAHLRFVALVASVKFSCKTTKIHDRVSLSSRNQRSAIVNIYVM